jgi:D-galacturonate reductase
VEYILLFVFWPPSLFLFSSSLSLSNPLISFCLDHRGHFAGQQGYGYVSIETFVQNVIGISEGGITLTQAEEDLASIRTTVGVTAILDAGRKSINDGGKPYRIVYSETDPETPVTLEPVF